MECFKVRVDNVVRCLLTLQQVFQQGRIRPNRFTTDYVHAGHGCLSTVCLQSVQDGHSNPLLDRVHSVLLLHTVHSFLALQSGSFYCSSAHGQTSLPVEHRKRTVVAWGESLSIQLIHTNEPISLRSSSCARPIDVPRKHAYWMGWNHGGVVTYQNPSIPFLARLPIKYFQEHQRNNLIQRFNRISTSNLLGVYELSRTV